MRRLLLVALLLALPSTAFAARTIRLMYEAPAPSSGGPAVAVTFVDERAEKQGGAERALVANERGAYGIPTAVLAGKNKTAMPDAVIQSWAVDCLKAAGYDARLGADPALPTVHVHLRKLWGDEIPLPMGSRQQFTLHVGLEFRPAGSEAAAHAFELDADGGTTTMVMRFDDPAESGFARTFDVATKQFLAALVAPEAQAVLGAANAEAAQAAAAVVGTGGNKDTADTRIDTAQAGAAGEATAATDAAPAATERAKGFETWDEETYQWSGGPKGVAGGFVATGIGFGLLIAGDQWTAGTARKYGGFTTARVGHALTNLSHIPLTDPDPGAPWVIEAVIPDIMFDYGVHITVPALSITIANLVAGNAGADIQTAKAVMGLAGLSYLAPGIASLRRFSLFAPHWAAHQVNQDRWAHWGLGIFPLVIGIVDCALAGVFGVTGALYAGNVIEARADEKGLLPMPTSGRRGLKNSARLVPFVAPDQNAITFGLAGVVP